MNCIVCDKPTTDDKICDECRDRANEDLMKHTTWMLDQVFKPQGSRTNG